MGVFFLGRKKAGKTKNADNRDGFVRKLLVPAVKGVLLAIIFTVACILVYALIIKLAGLDETSIPVVNQIIKIIAIVLAAFSANTAKTSQNTLRGLLAGGLYIILGFLIFSLIEGQFGLVPIMLADLLMGIIIGAIIGFISTKTKKKESKKILETS